MKITVLGCSGAEFPGHYPPSFLLSDRILLDAGSLTQVLGARAQARITDIFITHAHLDHIRSIPLLADNDLIGGKLQKVNILGIPPVMRVIKRNLLNNAVWPDFTSIPDVQNGILNLIDVKEGESTEIHGYTITPYRVNHSVPAVGYLVEDNRGKRLFYTGDMGPCGSTWEKMGNVKIDCLIIETTFPNHMGELARKAGHLTPRLLKNELSKMRRAPERIYITHLKPQHAKVIRQELKGLKIDHLSPLRDGDIIRV